MLLYGYVHAVIVSRVKAEEARKCLCNGYLKGYRLIIVVERKERKEGKERKGREAESIS